MKTLIVGHYGKGNLGDEIILQQILKKSRDLTVLTENLKDTEIRQEHKRNLKRPENTLKSLIGFIPKINKFDKIILGGGGLIFDESKKGIFQKNARYYLFFPLLGKILRKEVEIYRIGIGPIFSPITKILIKIALKKCKISVRDIQSKNFLDEINIFSILRKDPAEEVKIQDRGKYHNLLIIRRLPSFNKEDKFEQKLIKEINKIKNKKVIVGIVDPKDKYLLDKIKLEKKEFYDIKQFLDYISKSNKIVSMRLHPLILGKSAGKRIYGINCDPKIENFLSRKNIIEIKEIEKIKLIFSK